MWLYQRQRGRDLFDLWLTLTGLGLTGDDLLAVFDPYRPPGLTAARAADNLRAKLDDEQSRTDLEPLVGEWPVGYGLDAAGRIHRRRRTVHSRSAASTRARACRTSARASVLEIRRGE